MGQPKPALTAEFINFMILWAIPSISQLTLMLFESLRVIPAEVRIARRIINRGRPNIVELIFFAIKYLAILGTLMSPLINMSTWLTPTSCLICSWIFAVTLSLCVFLVSLSMCWRCYIIFQRNRKVAGLMASGLIAYFAMNAWACVAQPKYDDVDGGYCTYTEATVSANKHRMWYQVHAAWFLLYSSLFDAVVVTAGTWRLIKFVKGPTGFQRIGRLLFLNNIHYLILICGVNFAQFWFLVFAFEKFPVLIWLTSTIQIMTCLQMLISEQDEAHGHGNKSGYTTGYRAGISGGEGTSLTGRSNLFAPLRSGKTGQSAMTTSLSQQQTFSAPETTVLEGIRFDELHESIVDQSTTITQLQLPTTDKTGKWDSSARPVTDNVAPWDNGKPDSYSPPAKAVDGGVSGSYHYGPSSPYSPSFGAELRNDTVSTAQSARPLVSPGVPHSAPATANSNNGTSIRAIRANLDNKSATSGSNGPSLSRKMSEDSYQMNPLHASSSAHDIRGGNANQVRKRTDSVTSTGTSCTCGRAEGNAISYGTALTRELTQGHGHTASRAGVQIDTTVMMHDGDNGATHRSARHHEQHQQQHQPHEPAPQYGAVDPSEQYHQGDYQGHHAATGDVAAVGAQQIEEISASIHPDAPFADYHSPNRYRF